MALPAPNIPDIGTPNGWGASLNTYFNNIKTWADGVDSQMGDLAKSATLVIGNTARGHTTAECDYICTGSADQTVINNAIAALPSTGGKIVIREGTYSLTGKISITKNNVMLSGMGDSTVLKRMHDETSYGGIVHITSSNNSVQDLCIEGNKSNYSKTSNAGLYIENGNFNILSNITCNNNASTGIWVEKSNNNSIVGNICIGSNHGIALKGSSNNAIVANVCPSNTNGSNSGSGVHLTTNSNNNTIVGNVCDNCERGIYIYNSCNGNTIIGNICNNSWLGIHIGTNNVKNIIAGNTLNNCGNCGLYLSAGNSINSIIGNICNDYTSGGITLADSSMNIIEGNTCIQGTGQPSDYTSSQHPIYLVSSNNHYNLVANNNIQGKNYLCGGGTSNTFINNKYN